MFQWLLLLLLALLSFQSERRVFAALTKNNLHMGSNHVEISVLTDDVLLSVFKYLSILDKIRVERVCCRWLKLSRISWQNVRSLSLVDLFEMDNEFITVRDCNKLLVTLLKRAGLSLRFLDVSDSNCNNICMDFNERSIRSIGKYCPNIVDLNLSYISLTNDHLKLLSVYCNRVEILKLVQCFEYELHADVGLITMLTNMKKLKYLDLSLNDTITGNCFNSVDRLSLETAIMNNCYKIEPANIQRLSFLCPNMKKFEMSGYLSTIAPSMTSFVRLEYLNLNSYEGDDVSLAYVLDKFHVLKYLDIGHSSLVNDETIVALARGCPSLETLNISGKFGRLTNVGFSHLAYCRNIQELDMSWLEAIDDRSLLKVAKNGSLRSLHAHLALNLSETGLLDVIGLCPKFYFLDITSCYRLSLNFLQKLSLHCHVNRKRITIHVSPDQVVSMNLEHFIHSYFCIVVIL